MTSSKFEFDNIHLNERRTESSMDFPAETTTACKKIAAISARGQESRPHITRLHSSGDEGLLACLPGATREPSCPYMYICFENRMKSRLVPS